MRRIFSSVAMVVLLAMVALLCGLSCKNPRQLPALYAPIILEARLMELSPIPPPDQDPHHYCLVVHVYEIRRVLSGNAPPPGTRIGVVQWAVRDNCVIPESKELGIGHTRTLLLDPWDARRELAHIQRYGPPSVDGANSPPYFFDVGLERAVVARELQTEDRECVEPAPQDNVSKSSDGS